MVYRGVMHGASGNKNVCKEIYIFNLRVKNTDKIEQNNISTPVLCVLIYKI